MFIVLSHIKSIIKLFPKWPWAELSAMHDTNVMPCMYETYNVVISLIAYLIYKSWLFGLLNNKQRQDTVSLEYFKPHLVYRASIYKELGWDQIAFVR